MVLVKVAARSSVSSTQHQSTFRQQYARPVRSKTGAFCAGSMNPLFESHLGSASHEEICHYAESIFQRIRQMIVERVAPTTLRSSFLDPIQTHMAVDTSIDIFSRSDKDFLSLFLGRDPLTRAQVHGFVVVSSVVHDLEEQCEMLRRRAAGLEKCKKEFQELSLLL